MDRRRVRRGRPHRERVDLDDVIYGVHAVDEALTAGERLRRLFVSDERRRDPALRSVLERANASGVSVRFANRGFFAEFPYKAHQGVVAYGQPFEYATVEEILARRATARPAMLVLLDHVTDPHNAGAILRAAECAGAAAAVLPERRAAGVNATVRKAASGATAHLPVARVANVAG
ncbi:MAG: 23S rRNA (guanosine(2251)-2'-O)-methyltransferase RlmB, partial [Candidatus Eremiobacteraeota bacterium]|nr:23S rRNA (guanosine(2251)-2'-O)-methyltransferase RlmB [Candidatus Eremiobacteraeota bacterium]